MGIATHEFGQTPAVSDRVARACPEAARLSHEARARMSAAGEAVEDGVHAARRAIKSVRRRIEDDFEDLTHEAIHQVKRHPLAAIGAAFGVGLAVGLAGGWIGRRCATARPNTADMLEAVL